jgi:hypothetical protein
MSDIQKIDCEICCEPFSQSVTTTQKTKKVKCNFCEFVACRGCVQRFISESNKDPHCMGCNTGWTREFLDSNLQKGFMKNEFKNYRERLLMDKEKSMLAEAQYHANHLILKETLDQSIEKKYKEFDAIRNSIKKIRVERHALVQKYRNNIKDKVNIPILHRQCPLEECNGCVGAGWKCGLCSAKICSSCHEVVRFGSTPEPTDPAEPTDQTEPTVAHVCTKENIDTAKALMQGTKPCPSCATLIFKISGCLQMFCVSCHTAFDWKTGTIVTGKIHNPHYYEHLRLTQGSVPRDPDDHPGDWACIEPGYNLIIQRVQDPSGLELNKCIEENNIFTHKSFKEDKRANKLLKVLSSFTALMYHLSEYELPRLRDSMRRQQKNLDLRVSFLLNRIDESEWKKQLQQREKKNMKTDDILKVCEMFHDVFREYILKILSNKDVNLRMSLIHEIFELKKYANEEFRKVSKRYSNYTPYLTSSFLFHESGQGNNGLRFAHFEQD